MDQEGDEESSEVSPPKEQRDVISVSSMSTSSSGAPAFVPSLAVLEPHLFALPFAAASSSASLPLPPPAPSSVVSASDASMTSSLSPLQMIHLQILHALQSQGSTASGNGSSSQQPPSGPTGGNWGGYSNGEGYQARDNSHQGAAAVSSGSYCSSSSGTTGKVRKSRVHSISAASPLLVPSQFIAPMLMSVNEAHNLHVVMVGEAKGRTYNIHTHFAPILIRTVFFTAQLQVHGIRLPFALVPIQSSASNTRESMNTYAPSLTPHPFIPHSLDHPTLQTMVNSASIPFDVAKSVAFLLP